MNGKCLDDDEFVCLEDVVLGFIMLLDGWIDVFDKGVIFKGVHSGSAVKVDVAVIIVKCGWGCQ